MQTLNNQNHSQLKLAVQQARATAEQAAAAVLTQLGCADAAAPQGMDKNARDLRNALRAHGRQLGDSREATGRQETALLTEELAYEHWHRRLVERLTCSYLGDWIKRLQAAAGREAEGRTAAAHILQERLKLILEGEPPYYIFVRRKMLEAQPIGWNPDMNDGVRVNISPFLSAPDTGGKGAGILRRKPLTMHWKNS